MYFFLEWINKIWCIARISCWYTTLHNIYAFYKILLLTWGLIACDTLLL